MRVDDVIHTESLTTREKIDNQTLLTGPDSEAFSKKTVSLRDRSGDTHTVEMRSISVPGFGANQKDSIYVFTDLSHYSSLKEELDFHSHYDQLTGLLNRKTFEKRVNLSIESAAQFNKQHVFCYLDINQFSAINDTCGTMAGDELLRRLAKRFQDVVRSGDTLARLGGDQFGILMEQCTTQQAERVIHKLLTSIDTFRFKWDGGFHKVTAAIGICQIDKETGSIDTLMADSSNACFLAKESGANNYHVFSDNDTQLVAHRSDLVWLDKLNYALEEDGFSLYVQRIQPIPFGASSKSHFEVFVKSVPFKQQIIHL
jgi:diguanylate cyclase (GGDEF)-like protein